MVSPINLEKSKAWPIGCEKETKIRHAKSKSEILGKKVLEISPPPNSPVDKTIVNLVMMSNLKVYK